MTTDPLTLSSIYELLTEPFPIDLIELKPGATTRDKARALALAYVDMRAYQARLDDVTTPDGWHVSYRSLGSGVLVCRLEILGVVREDVGECEEGDPNRATSALAQSFKRACAAFGLGRYLYHLPQMWAPYDSERKQFQDAPRIAKELYRAAGLL
jgi:hypothetical protein